MKLLIISHAPHKKLGNHYVAYGPYVNEMRLWEQFVDAIHIVAPLSREPISAIELNYKHPNIHFSEVPAFSVIDVKNTFKTFFKIPGILWTLFKAMSKADHIHLRCPGNMGLLGCFVQLLFPKKKKSAKYAGNWDPRAKQPFSYRIQKYILNNPFLTRNMQVMVYGSWPNVTKNCVPFFTATYPKSKCQKITKEFQPPLKALFIGALSKGKNPLYAVQLIDKLFQTGLNIQIDLYGEGPERTAIETYIETHQLQKVIHLQGNQSSEVVEEAYKNKHFLILPSNSEGWPKAVAEAMFWGCVPLATPVSCVAEMLANGERGVLLTKQMEQDVTAFINILNNNNQLQKMSLQAQTWSQQYTLEAFEEKIKDLLKK